MKWVTIIWSMSAAACLTLALVHGFIWYRQRDNWGNLLFTLMTVATAALAGGELAMMRAETPAVLAATLRWTQVPVWVILISLVGFVRIYLHAGRAWLGWSACLLRTLSLFLDFLTGQNLNFREITSIRHVSLLGDSVSIAHGIPNPWMLVGQLSLALLVIFVADAAIAVWRRGERRKALVVGGSIVFFALSGSVEAVLVFWGWLQWPITASLFYSGIVAAMAYELSRDVLRAAQLVRDLRESEQRMILAAEAANFGVWIRDFVRDEIWANDRWRALYGFSKSERLDLDSILSRLHPHDRDSVRRKLAKASERDGEYESEYRIVLPDGGVRWIASRGRVEHNGGGNPVCGRGISMDITQRKEAELQARLHRDQVSHLMRVASLGEISSALAHELDQPLTAILSNAQAAQHFLAREQFDRTEIRDILQDIVADDQRASEVISRLRMLLRKSVSKAQALDVNELAQDVLRLMNGDLTARAVSVVTEFTTGLAPVRGDRVQLQQVLINLVLNARDAMAAVARRTLTFRSSWNEGGIRISVGDTGSGIPPGSEEKIFEPYHTSKKEGLGLGLSLSRSIVHAHGGRLWAENSTDGATFHVALPQWDGQTP